MVLYSGLLFTPDLSLSYVGLHSICSSNELLYTFAPKICSTPICKITFFISSSKIMCGPKSYVLYFSKYCSSSKLSISSMIYLQYDQNFAQLN